MDARERYPRHDRGRRAPDPAARVGSGRLADGLAEGFLTRGFLMRRFLMRRFLDG
jgi:hypothetical protein